MSSMINETCWRRRSESAEICVKACAAWRKAIHNPDPDREPENWLGALWGAVDVGSVILDGRKRKKRWEEGWRRWKNRSRGVHEVSRTKNRQVKCRMTSFKAFSWVLVHIQLSGFVFSFLPSPAVWPSCIWLEPEPEPCSVSAQVSWVWKLSSSWRGPTDRIQLFKLKQSRSTKFGF